MNELKIRLTGTVQNTNFDEWKQELIAQIKTTETDLITDDDFFIATKQVKMFKNAENSLKRAKQSAIDQAADIQKLFTAIDEISEEARQTRLTLTRQIKSRKIEIKDGLINSGIETVKKIIDPQNSDFQLIDHSKFLDRTFFLNAVKGKAGIKGMQNAIDHLIEIIKVQIKQKASEVKNNAAKLNNLSNEHKILFQDRMALLSLNTVELDLTIDKRIASYNEGIATKKTDKLINELNQLEDEQLNLDSDIHSNQPQMEIKNEYKLTVDIFSTKELAIEIARSIREKFSDIDSVKNIKLSRVYNLVS